jgi:hypothetical protein
MRKVFWCFTGAGVLMAGALSAASYYACNHPDTMIGHCLNTVASASFAMEPVTALASRVAKVTHHAMNPEATTTTAGSCEECVPADPEPIAQEPAAKLASGLIDRNFEVELGPAPIVINEDEPIQHGEEAEAPPSTIEFKGEQSQELPESACPMVMPYCTDDDEPMATPTMPYADGATKQADGSEVSEDSVFKAWTKLLEKPRQESKPDSSEELPAPAEDPQEEPKCQEDSHLHEHYSGCPHMTCPYTGKTYPSCEPAMKSGKEEISEEPEMQPKKHGKKPHTGKSKECPHTEGVDTMEYRRSDGGLNEYGPGPF